MVSQTKYSKTVLRTQLHRPTDIFNFSLKAKVFIVPDDLKVGKLAPVGEVCSINFGPAIENFL